MLGSSLESSQYMLRFPSLRMASIVFLGRGQCYVNPEKQQWPLCQSVLVCWGSRWNPAVEQQAQDRIHRLGQYKPIHVTRFIIGGTIEERILKLQACDRRMR